jgi:hypothetical protein
MEPIEVTARFDANGKITPVKFTRQGVACRVESIGRSWQANDGVHILVMTPENKVYHLLFKPAGGNWYLLRGGVLPSPEAG